MTDETGERPPDELHGSYFAIVPEWLLAEASDLVKLYAILDRYANKKGTLWPGQVELAERMECSDRHVRKLLSRMKEIGAIEVVRRRFNGSTIYRLVKERPEPPFLTDRNVGSTLTGTDAPPKQSQLERAKEPEPSLSRDFDLFWAAYPRKASKPESRKAFTKAVKKVGAQTLINAATRYAQDPNLPGLSFIPHASRWLNDERWEDGPMPQRMDRRPKPRTADSAMEADPRYWEEP